MKNKLLVIGTSSHGSWLGIGSVISNNSNITSRCKFNVDAMVVKNITEPGTYVGVSARRVV
ncbi:hypothetical protein COL17_17040 [Priestia megaterium]|nr:hypothetical protein COL17_17040 [Priestia megaterium]